MERTEREKDKQYYVALICVCIVLVLGVGGIYLMTLRNNLMDQAIGNVLDVTRQQEQSFDTFISADRERLHSYATYFSHMNSGDTVGVRERLNVFSTIDAYYSVINLETGEYFNNKSDKVFVMQGEELEEYRSLTGADIREPYPGLYSGKTSFGYYERFEFADGVSGIFQKAYESEQVSEDFSLSFYGEQGRGYIVSREGDILMRSNDESEKSACDNLFKMVVGSEAAEESGKEFIEVLRKRETGTTIFESTQGEQICTYVPVENVRGWYLISVVPVEAVMAEADTIIKKSQFAIMFLTIVMMFSLGFLLLKWQSHKEISKKEQEIEYNKQQFDIFSTYLSNTTDDVYIMLNGKGHRIEYVSSNVERVLGVSMEDALKDVRLFGRAKYCSGKRVEFADLDAMEPGTSFEPVMTERIHAKTGEHRWFWETVYSVLLQGEKKIVIYLSDRTRERETQNTLTQALDLARVANKAKSTFLSSVSHDIRTPMNAIMGLVTLLSEEAHNPERVLEYTQRINAASQHLLGLINDVLDMNKIEGGNATLNISEVNMAEVIEELNVIIRPQSKAKDQTFRIFASSFSHESVLGDKLRINQILINILSNAVKYTPEGGCIELEVCELPGVTEGYSRIEFVIRDNGQGMSPEYLEVLFQPFSREDKPATKEIQGTGLGMAITKSLVDLMGGTIEVESELGVGTTFKLDLDLRICEDDEEDLAFWEKHGVRRMIVADDDEYVCQNIVQAMAHTGVDVRYTTNGKKVVEMMRTARETGEPYDVMILDWKMPEFDGMETARLIRDNYPVQIPILFFTSYDWSEIEEEALEVGVNNFLMKPFFMHSFKEAIERLMDIRKKNSKEKDTQKEKSVFEGKHILVVDDIEVNRLILVKILESLGASVCDIAKDGQEAVDIFNNSKSDEYDVIFMDVQMPVLDGYGATRAIRVSGHPSAKSVPIIAMTANAFVDDIRDALESGMDAHVSKPVIVDQLKATFQEVLERRERYGESLK
ncbi:MAG: response regulator [Dorea sp.]|nr:response regulator [Dorea sp.]